MASPASPEFVPFTDKLWVEQIRPSFIGGLIAFLLLGVSLVQFKRVFRLLSRGNQTEVSRTSKLTWTLLILLFLANITDTVAKSHYLSTLIQGCAVNGVAYLSGKYPKSAFFYASVDATIASLTHIAFIRRTLKLVGNARDYFRDKARVIMVVTYGLLILIAGLSLTSLAASIVESFIIINIKFPELEKIDITLALWLGGSTAADILLSAVFSFHLAYQRKAASSHQTVDLVDKWMTLSLQTGLAPAVLNLLHLVWFYAQEELGYHYAVSFWTPKVYVIAVLTLYEAVLSDPAFQKKGSSGSVGHTSGTSNRHGQGTYQGTIAYPPSTNYNSNSVSSIPAGFELTATTVVLSQSSATDISKPGGKVGEYME